MIKIVTGSIKMATNIVINPEEDLVRKAIELIERDGTQAHLLAKIKEIRVEDSGDSFGFVTTSVDDSGRPIESDQIVHLNRHKIQEAVKASHGLPEEAIKDIIIKAMAQVIVHEGEHLHQVEQGVVPHESGAESVQRQFFEGVKNKNAAKQDGSDVFEKFGFKDVRPDNVAPSAKKLLEKLSLPVNNKNIAMLCVGYLISMGHNPHHVAASFSKMSGENIDIEKSAELINVLEEIEEVQPSGVSIEPVVPSAHDGPSLGWGWDDVSPFLSGFKNETFYPQVHPPNY